MADQTPLNARHLPRYTKDLIGLARHLGLSAHAAEDVVQSCHLAALRQLRAGREITEPRAYLKTALRHACAHHAARAARETPLPEGEIETRAGAAVPDATLAVLLGEVHAQLAALPEPHARLLRRVAEGETSPQALAREFDLPVGTIMSRLARARAQLRAALGLKRGQPFL
ncbi:RNA polymerase sigma factor [Roseobacteraceae bacterium S113]